MNRDTRPSLSGKSSGMAQQQQREVFSFPIIEFGEILLCLHELGIPVTEDDLVNPEKNKDQIRRMFENLAEMVTGITKEEMSQPGLEVIHQLQEINKDFQFDNHRDSFAEMNSFRACQKMMEVCGVSHFGLKDLMAPTSKKLKRQLS